MRARIYIATLLLAHAGLATACLRSASECATSNDCDSTRVCELGQCVLAPTDAGPLEDAGTHTDASDDAGACEPSELLCQGSCAVCGLGVGIDYACEGASCVEIGCVAGYEPCDDGCCLAPPSEPFEVADGGPPAIHAESLDLLALVDGSLWLSFIESDGSLGVANWTDRGWSVQRALASGCEAKSSLTELLDDQDGLIVSAWCDGGVVIFERDASRFAPSPLTDEVDDVVGDVVDFELLVTQTMRAIAYTMSKNQGEIELTVRELGEDPSATDVITITTGVSQLAFTASDREVLAAWVERGGTARVNSWRADDGLGAGEGWATPGVVSDGVVAMGLTTTSSGGPSALVVRRDPSVAQLHELYYFESDAVVSGPNTVATGDSITNVSRADGVVGASRRSAFGLFDLAGGVTYLEELEGEWRVRSGRAGCNSIALSPRAFALTQRHIVAASADADGDLCIETNVRSASAVPR